MIKIVGALMRECKTLVGMMLSILTGRGLGDTRGSTAAQTAGAFRTAIVSNATSTLGLVQPALLTSSSLFSGLPFFDSPLLHGAFDFVRVLCHVLLGLNGFSHPFVAFLADLACVGFFMLASAQYIYSMAFLRRLAPGQKYAMTTNRRDESIDGAEARESGAHAAVGSSSASLSAPPLLLFSPQFFTVNAVIFLLLASSLPLATWMLGLSSFDLLDFYPSLSPHFASSPGTGPSSSHHASAGSGSHSLHHVPFVVHLYNLSFLALTGWNLTAISRKLVLWAFFDPFVLRVELLVERVRVAGGWADPQARPEHRFRLFGRAMPGGGGEPLSTFQSLLAVVRFFYRVARTLIAPFAAIASYILRAMGRVVYAIASTAWEALTAFVRKEVEDEDECAWDRVRTRRLLRTRGGDSSGSSLIDSEGVTP
jgi:hypothetical protein